LVLLEDDLRHLPAGGPERRTEDKVKKPKAARVAVLNGEVLLRPLRALLPTRARWLTYRDLCRELSVDRPRFTGIFRAKGVLMQELPYDASGPIRDRTTTPQPPGRAARRIGESILDAYLEQSAVAIREESNTTDVLQELASHWPRSFLSSAGPQASGPRGTICNVRFLRTAGAAGLARDHAIAAGSSTAAGFTGPFMSRPSAVGDRVGSQRRLGPEPSGDVPAGIEQLVTTAKDMARGHPAS